MNACVGRSKPGCYNREMPEALSPAELGDANQRLNDEERRSGKMVLQSFPLHIQIGADNRCNLRCSFCLAAAYREKGLTHIQDRRLERNVLELFERLAPYAKYWKHLSLTGPGESLLNPKLGDILALVRRQSDCAISITTNGVLINERWLGVFLDNRVDEISISMDSLKRDVYEELRVNASFDKIMRVIDLINGTKRARSSAIPRLNLTPNFSRRNIKELPAIIQFAKEKGISVVQATPTQIYRKSWVKDSLVGYPRLTRKMAEEAEALAAELGVRFANELRMVYINRGRGLLGFLEEPEAVDFPTDPSTCVKPWSGLYVDPDGETHPCCYLSPVYGNLFETPFEELWNGAPAQALRKAMIEKTPPQPCRDCYEFNRHQPSVMIQLD
jgi:radical SAM protein with 4Fe4S-binding SPASM domain